MSAALSSPLRGLLGSPLRSPLYGGVGGGVAPVALISAVGTDGFKATWASGTPPTFAPDSSPVSDTWTRQGYAYSAGAVSATTYTEARIYTKRIREPYPTWATLTANTVALSDYVYNTDTCAGVTNASLEVSPKPVAQWVWKSRGCVDTTVDLEIVAFHRDARNGQQVAAIEFSATDGTNTVTQVVSGVTAVSGRPGDVGAVQSIKCLLDISTLTDDSLITCHAKVYPWIGAAASVRDSRDLTSQREFSARYFWKNSALAAAPPVCYVSNTAYTGSQGATPVGVDATGVWSTSHATAAATPFLTIAGAMTAWNNATRGINAATGLGNKMDAAVIVCGEGTFVLGSIAAGTATQNYAEMVITRDTGVSKALSIITWGAAGYRPRLGATTAPVTENAIRFYDITINRTGNLTLDGTGSGGFVNFTFENVNLNYATFGANWQVNSYDCIFGMVATNSATACPFDAPSLVEHRIIRGLTATLPPATGIDGWCVLGSNLTTCPAHKKTNGETMDGSMRAFNRYTNPFTGGNFDDYGATFDCTGVANVGNIFEYISTTSATMVTVNADNATGNVTHMISHNNTCAGFFIYGRENFHYDDGPTPRSSKLQSVKGNIYVQMNTKGDRFMTDGLRVGNWGFLYGVGCQGNFTMYIDATSGGLGSEFAQEYPGLGCDYGTSATVRNDPLFVAYAGTTNSGATPVAGAGGGDYNLQAGSPAKAMVSNAVLGFDYAGTARPTTGDSAGAYYKA